MLAALRALCIMWTPPLVIPGPRLTPPLVILVMTRGVDCGAPPLLELLDRDIRVTMIQHKHFAIDTITVHPGLINLDGALTLSIQDFGTNRVFQC